MKRGKEENAICQLAREKLRGKKERTWHFVEDAKHKMYNPVVLAREELQ